MKPEEGEIVLVHGLWFGAWSLGPLARRLERTGLPVRRFSYRTTRAGLDDHARRLHEFVNRGPRGVRYYVGHSLGGLVILRMLGLFGDPSVKRVVLLGSPIKGSGVARRARRVPGFARITGRVRKDLERGFEECPGGIETGMIAGDRSIGLGWLLGGLGEPSDGTVAVSETRAAWLKEHSVLPVTHTGMIYSSRVAKEALQFLENGCFRR